MATRTLRAFSDADLTRIADAYHAWRGTETSAGQPYADVAGRLDRRSALLHAIMPRHG